MQNLRLVVAYTIALFVWMGLPQRAGAQQMLEDLRFVNVEEQKPQPKQLLACRDFDEENNGPVKPTVQKVQDYTPRKRCGTAFTDCELPVDDIKCPSLDHKTPISCGVMTCALATMAGAVLVLRRRKRAALWILGSVSAVVLMAAGFIWGLSKFSF